jgi:hypothetical protein
MHQVAAGTLAVLVKFLSIPTGINANADGK